ncbi:MAG: hypothetical protein A3F53_00390 [Candidatus Zambryskibacteria bacterium RIFCSPHIGHO2_12_FULL_48_10]|uniref:Peptidoglycan binding-like domain-containing protein n=1 Tax=Candidatus Zambryskibacteria bacterium RIFCSPHIGHO2_01_FULL_46_25 TaxID=1802738 RepID=A0A1G2T0H2_9BACT|nr:MAG: hypothetical protein A2838_03290 [Candidatus Zambryskibacteria bacterium RIFCSPHIGHO2_01_FULL_46_25]OHB00801.1 MAG: hypothetical protein A3F53_00390 [Candidatus Zambryskibacteria bacterium RIFCSPHIGHO2_12_FULL_48_10]OHB07136.1 MAG: hypothetical protein A3A31_00200 [Candidatus Zambryskibacteria bacterium RIFCSPLOWO2_01_FULL_48_25]
MLKTRIAKIAAITVGLTFALSFSVDTAGAVTIAELQAQINALMAQLASLQGSSVPAGASITSDLTIGSTGAQVVALQSALVAQGHLVMPAGVAMGYFGSLTKAAVIKWQAANGVPNTGYFGPLSRAKFNASGATGTVPGSTVGGGTVGGTIGTPGVEGTITVSLNPSPASGVKLYEGDSKKQVLGIKLEAQQSDIKVERIKVDLDSITNTGDNLTYTKIAQKIYVMDGSTVLASSDLNSDTVVKDGSDYFITLSGFGFIVPAQTIKVLYIALDARSSWDSTYDNDSWSLGIQVDGVRGVDGVGVNEYGPSTAFTRTFSSTADLVDSATLAISLNSGTPATQQVICQTGTSSDECDGLEVAKIDFKAEKDQIKVTDFVLDIARAGGAAATSSTAYLYDGSSLVGSASVASTDANTMTATFSDIDWIIPADTTKTLSVKFDIIDAVLVADTFIASTDAGDTTAENSAGTAVVATGSADAKTITIRKEGPELTLLSKSITTDGVPMGSPFSGGTSTSTLTAKFNVRVKALGADLSLGTSASTTPAFAKTLAVNSFTVYKEGVAAAVNHATSTSYTIPSTCVTSTTNSCTLAEGASVDIEVTYLVPGRLADGTSADATTGLYSVGLERFNWNTTTSAVQETTFMAGLTDWRTADVSFP